MGPDISAFRSEHYNARVVQVDRVHDHLMILRVVPDRGRPSAAAGQYTVLGLGSWESRVDGLTPRRPGAPKLIRRAYSICCPILDPQHQLAPINQLDFLEFFIALVSTTSDDPPVLTPRLFQLAEGQRLHCGTRPRGTYTLAPLRPDDDVVLAATGTGEAPHNAMVTELLKRGHRGHIYHCVCVRYRRDLAYLARHRELEQRFPRYRYVALTTREPENLDASHPNFVGKRYLQEFFASGQFEQLAGPLDPARTHVFLCGNPAMIGLPRHTSEGRPVFPEQTGMVEVLEHHGFQLDETQRPGNIHFEKYW